MFRTTPLFTAIFLFFSHLGTSKVLKELSEASVDLGLATLRDVDNWKSAVISSHSIYDGLQMLQELAEGETLHQLTLKVFNKYGPPIVREHQNEQRRNLSQLANVKFNYADIVTLKRLNNLVISVHGLENGKLIKYAKIDQNSAQLMQGLNANVSRLSNGIIKDAFAVEPQQAPLMLTNVIYFKGEWKYKFNKSLTEHNQPFRVESDKCKQNGQNPKVSLMNIEMPVPNRWFSEINATGIRLPFAGDDVSLYLFLPSYSVPVDLVMKALNGPALMHFIKQLGNIPVGEESEDNDVKLELPIFDAKTLISVKGTLERLGVKDMFDPSVANFKKFKDMLGPNLYVTDVKHKAFFKVNEEGAEAAALTSVGLGFRSLPLSFRFDRPFIYVLANTRTAEVYFMGRYMGPNC